ncbi:MAG: alpha/beta hydrolase, partial [Chloroflexota bacterium]
VFIGTHDLFLPDCRKLVEVLGAANVPVNYYEYRNMIHDWMLVVNLPEAGVVMTQLVDLIGKGATSH